MEPVDVLIQAVAPFVALGGIFFLVALVLDRWL